VRNADIDRALGEAAESDGIVAREIERVGLEERTLRMHAARFPAGRGPRAGTVAVFHDVSEIRRLEQVRRDFIANASHELRTPLTSIQGFADTLLEGEFSAEDAAGPLGAIARNAQRLGVLIEDLLELSRIESRRAPLRPGEVDASRVCSILIEDAEPRLREARLEARSRVGHGIVAWVDQGALEQAITNLLDNAIKYTEPGGHVSLEVTDLGERIEIAVQDDGVGIPEEELDRIFERFYRVDKARSRALGGTGLGLAIVKHLAQAMGGDVQVESQPGRGSRFVLNLPAAKSAAEAPARSG